MFLVSVCLRACIRRCVKTTRDLHFYATLQRIIHATLQPKHCSHNTTHQVKVTNAQAQQRTGCCGVARCLRFIESQRATPVVIEEHGARKAPNKVVVVVITHVLRQWWHAFGRCALGKYLIPPGAARTFAFSIGATALRWMIPAIHKPAVFGGPIKRGPLIFRYPRSALLRRTPNLVVGVGGQRCKVIPPPIEDQAFWGPRFHLHPAAVSHGLLLPGRKVAAVCHGRIYRSCIEDHNKKRNKKTAWHRFRPVTIRLHPRASGLNIGCGGSWTDKLQQVALFPPKTNGAPQPAASIILDVGKSMHLS